MEWVELKHLPFELRRWGHKVVRRYEDGVQTKEQAHVEKRE